MKWDDVGGRKGAFTYDVCKNYRIFEPLFPVSTKFTQPPFLWSDFGQPPLPLQCRRHLYMPTKADSEWKEMS